MSEIREELLKGGKNNPFKINSAWDNSKNEEFFGFMRSTQGKY